MSATTRIGALLAASIVCPPHLFGQQCHQDTRQSLVRLHARGQVESGPSAGSFVDSYASGFIVSSDGLILTVYHLIGKLGRFIPETVSIDAQIGELTAPVNSAQIIEFALTTDLLLLKIPPGQQPYKEVQLGRALDHDPAKPVFTSGFSAPEDAPAAYRAHSDQIQSQSGPGGSLWMTGFQFRSGESGSPVYDEHAQVLGIVKGDAHGVGYMIPIEFADSLLAQVRLRQLQQAMKDFDLLRRQFDWSGEVVPEGSGKAVSITCEKLVGGKPDVAKIDVNVVVVGIDKEHQNVSLTPFQFSIPRTAPSGEGGGAFRSTELWTRVENLTKIYEGFKVTELVVDIVPTLSDGQKPFRKRIAIKY